MTQGERHVDQELEKIRQMLLGMGATIEEMIAVMNVRSDAGEPTSAVDCDLLAQLRRKRIPEDTWDFHRKQAIEERYHFSSTYCFDKSSDFLVAALVDNDPTDAIEKRREAAPPRCRVRNAHGP